MRVKYTTHMRYGTKAQAANMGDHSYAVRRVFDIAVP